MQTSSRELGNKESWSHVQTPAGEPFLNEFLRLFGCAGQTAAELLNGTLNVKHRTAAFARKLPTWCLPVPGHVALLFTRVGDADPDNVALLFTRVGDVDVLGAHEAVLNL